MRKTGPKPRPLAERFWPKVHQRGADECWEWRACRDGSGYGRIGHNGRAIPASRASWMVQVGPIPEGRMVLHHCDNPPCVNILHLYLGDHADNARDASERGLLAGRSGLPGEENPRSKLTQSDVVALRRDRHESGMTYRQLGAKYGIRKQYAWSIATGRNWSHIKEGLPA